MKKQTLIWIGTVVAICILGMGVYGLIQRQSGKTPREQHVRTVFNGLGKHPDSTVLIEDIPGDSVTTRSSYHCGKIQYFGLFGTQSSLADVQAYYRDSFADLTWTTEQSDYLLAASVDQDTVVYVYEADMGSVLWFEIALELFENAKKEYQTLFFVEVSNKNHFLCNRGKYSRWLRISIRNR